VAGDAGIGTDMPILFVSNSGESLPIALRLKQEGTKATVYLQWSKLMEPKLRNNVKRKNELKKLIKQ
jgi:hypothetical protein